MYLCDCGDIYDFNRFCFKNWSHKNPIWDLILIYITEFSIKSCACTQIFRPVKKIFSRISSYLLWDSNDFYQNFSKSYHQTTFFAKNFTFTNFGCGTRHQRPLSSQLFHWHSSAVITQFTKNKICTECWLLSCASETKIMIAPPGVEIHN